MLDLHPPLGSHNLGLVLKVKGTMVVVDSGMWAGMPGSEESGRHVAKLGP